MKSVLKFARHSFLSLALVLVMTFISGNTAYASQVVNEGSGIESNVTIPTITARAHVQKLGWISSKNGVIGTTGKSLRLEAIQLSVSGVSGLGIKYRAHVQGIGWQSYVANGATAGTQGKSKRVEAVQIELTGENADKYDIYYRAHAQGLGWLAWAKNGEKSGTEGYSKRLEAIQIKILPKGTSFDVGTGSAYNKKQTISMQAHVQSYGWMKSVESGQTLGVTGKSKRLEAIKLTPVGYDMNIEYSVHVQSIGWTGYAKNGGVAGTTGRGLRIEAVKIKLSGNDASKYDVYYRAHVQGAGWLDWAKNDEIAGTTGASIRMEALDVRIVPKGSAAPGSTNSPYLKSQKISYRSYVQNTGFQPYVGSGTVSGTTGKGLSINQLQITAAVNEGLGVEYSVHISGTGWTGWFGDDELAGVVGKQIEAVKIRLTGDNAKYYNVYYRAHSANVGWLGWTSNGSAAGTTKISKGMQAIQIVIQPKGQKAPGSTNTPYKESLNSILASDSEVVKAAKTKLNQIGWNLRSAFNWSASMPYYTNSTAVPSGYTCSSWYALYGFRNGRGNCYNMAATFYQMAKVLGYTAYYVQGYVPKKGGGKVTHGWVEIVLNGKTYVFDPNYTNETGKDGYQIYYGKSGTWRYMDYGRVN